MKKENNQYNPSYTEEQNAMIHQYLEEATEQELVECITELQNLYEEDVPTIKQVFVQLEKEVRERDIYKQKFEALKKCKNDWRKYKTSLENYKDAVIIRKKYADFKKSYKEKAVFDEFLLQHQYDDDFPAVCDNTIQRAVLSEKADGYIRKPEPPYIYNSMDEIEVSPMNTNESLGSLGKDNLKYLLMLMLYNIDAPNANIVPIIVMFLTRRYASTSHKRNEKRSLFSTNLLSTPDLIEKNKKFLEDIRQLSEESEVLVAEIKELE